ncbi:MAG: mycothiol system anti-sigma-R factor [Intrasporangiaceae bacterium]|nr:mycothiol system anti-sigma-R factor [Intrasporangiaceae bacterium]
MSEVGSGPQTPHFHDTDCSEFLFRIYEYIDGEMGQEERLRFEAHVKTCTPCLRQHEVDRTVKSLIRRAAPPAVAPESLRAAIVARITSIRIDPVG